jgi:hypothetical protein
MMGPDGTAFGRGWVDVRLPVADSLEECVNSDRKSEFLAGVIAMMATGPSRISTVVDTADGGRTPARGFKWTCPKK